MSTLYGVRQETLEAYVKAERKKIWEEAARIADNHECGGVDDIVCQHQNCAMIISAMCLAQAAKETQP